MGLNSNIQRIVICFLISILIFSYPIYLSYYNDSGGIFLALVILILTVIDLLATILIVYNNNIRKHNINVSTFFCVLSFCIIICLAWNFSKKMNWLYYIDLLISVGCFIFLLQILKRSKRKNSN